MVLSLLPGFWIGLWRLQFTKVEERQGEVLFYSREFVASGRSGKGKEMGELDSGAAWRVGEPHTALLLPVPDFPSFQSATAEVQ